MNEIVILTPTYNRVSMLPKLYESLKKQTMCKFTWLVVDDGSSDGTKSIIDTMKKESIVDIKYVYQKNGGKARALNRGFAHCKHAQIYLIVDSDDYLLPNAIDIVSGYLNRYYSDGKIGALFFHYNTTDGKILKLSGEVIKTDQIMTPYQYNKAYGKHDGCIGYFNRVTEKYTYPEYEDEKYVGPTVIQMEMSSEFHIVYSPAVVGVAEYQTNGLTHSGRQLRLENPKGMIHYCKLMMSPQADKLTQIKYAISIWPYINISKTPISRIFRSTKRPILLLLTYIPGIVLTKRWKKSVIKRNENV